MISQEYDFLQQDYTLEGTELYLLELVASKYSDKDATQIIKAVSLARKAHRNQHRCDDLPFLIHPMRVALMLVKFERNIISKVFIAALLHDTLEDTPLSYEEIESKFGSYVAKLVQAVTRRHDVQNLQEKHDAKLQNWREIMLNSHEVRAIKTFEDLDNMICWKNIPRESIDQKKIPRWLAEVREMSLPLAHATNLMAYNLMQQEFAYYDSLGYTNQPITI